MTKNKVFIIGKHLICIQWPVLLTTQSTTLMTNIKPQRGVKYYFRNYNCKTKAKTIPELIDQSKSQILIHFRQFVKHFLLILEYSTRLYWSWIWIRNGAKGLSDNLNCCVIFVGLAFIAILLFFLTICLDFSFISHSFC